MSEHMVSTRITYGKVDYAAAVLILEAHREELADDIGEQNAEATIEALYDLADEQNEDDDSGDEGD